jgi:hypothetical protein
LISNSPFLDQGEFETDIGLSRIDDHDVQSALKASY